MQSIDVLNLDKRKKKQFENKGINSVEDLLYRFPRKYKDYSVLKNTRTAKAGDNCAMTLLVMSVEYINCKNPFIKAVCLDKETQAKVSVLWFNMSYMYNELRTLRGVDVICAGIFNLNEKIFNYEFVNPDIFSDDFSCQKIFPVYSSIAGMSAKFYKNTVQSALTYMKASEPLPDYIRQKYGLVSEDEMIKQIHAPQSREQLEEAYKKLAYNYIYEYAMNLSADARNIHNASPFIPNLLTRTNELIKKLPYELTQDQKHVISEFINSAQNGKRVNALIQGDVGCGKTVCAFLLMFAMADNGYQSALMAPTSVLAKQHFLELSSYANSVGYKAVYLGGDLKAAEKRAALAQIESGEADFVVGTHAVVSDSVVFKNLALTIVDEEHKFGVVQRDNLKEKASQGVHSISMSATPIPRSLALAVYGDALDVYNITTMPNGRKPVLTEVVNNESGAFRFMLMQINQGRQCYIVCPLITTSEKADIKEDRKPLPVTVEEMEKKTHAFFDKWGVNIGVVTGKMKDSEKNVIIDNFKNGKTQILIATTIIEVGVNVPNATVISIENAERFGLAGLHQLRGRVGRGSIQSYCMLRSSETNNPRLKIMCMTTDGFKIAEEDLKLRGTGELLGIKQSGVDVKFEYVLKYPKIYADLKKDIKDINREHLAS